MIRRDRSDLDDPVAVISAVHQSWRRLCSGYADSPSKEPINDVGVIVFTSSEGGVGLKCLSADPTQPEPTYLYELVRPPGRDKLVYFKNLAFGPTRRWFRRLGRISSRFRSLGNPDTRQE
jgi:hypothetical protein